MNIATILEGVTLRVMYGVKTGGNCISSHTKILQDMDYGGTCATMYRPPVTKIDWAHSVKQNGYKFISHATIIPYAIGTHYKGG